MFPPVFQVTSEMLWRSTLVLAVIDAAFVPILVWRTDNATFRQFKWALVTTTAIFMVQHLDLGVRQFLGFCLPLCVSDLGALADSTSLWFAVCWR
jgi:hypothetical protein